MRATTYVTMYIRVYVYVNIYINIYILKCAQELELLKSVRVNTYII